MALSPRAATVGLYLAARFGRRDLADALVGCGASVDGMDFARACGTPLHLACAGGYVDVADLLLDRGADVTERDENGVTSLHCAAARGMVEAVKLLVRRGADIGAKMAQGATALDAALREWSFLSMARTRTETSLSRSSLPLTHGSLETVKLLVKHGASVSRSKFSQDTPLQASLLAGQFGIADWLVDQGALQDDGGQRLQEIPLLFFAISSGRTDVAEWLFRHGYDTNVAMQGSTLLHFAIFKERVDMVRFLLDRGSDPNARNEKGITVLGLACATDQVQSTKILLQSGADVDLPAMDTMAPIFVAASAGDLETVELLHRHGANIRSKSANQNPLVGACVSGKDRVVEYLLNHGADVAAAVEGGLTPLFFALSHRQFAVAELLHRNGHTLEATADSNCTLLHFAAERGNTEAIEWILQRPSLIDIDAKDDDDMTPLHCACKNGHADAARVLIDNGAEINATSDGRLTPLLHAAGNAHFATTKKKKKKKKEITMALPQETILFLAAREGRFPMMRWLYEYVNAERELEHDDLLSPLMAACQAGNADAVEFLLDKGAKSVVGDNPLEEAAMYGHVGIVELILSREPRDLYFDGGVEGSGLAKAMVSALHTAVIFRYLDVVRVLVDYGVDVNGRNNEQWTALHRACDRGNLEMDPIVGGGWCGCKGVN
ncbi:ankyrin repeat-containing domain protein [Zopfochytrium polystomum]|nr:ankyrin repeat-containing domain protein [Zopfochytrium polystomum]